MQEVSYKVGENTYQVIDSDSWKFVRSRHYNYDFCKTTGYFARWGRTFENDPLFGPAGPEILDIEISVNGCSNACPFCSPAGTKVNTPDGERDIEDLKVGDMVLGHNGQTVVEQTIKEVYSREYAGEIIEIELENGKILRLTPDHPIILIDNSEIKAGQLTPDMEVLGIG